MTKILEANFGTRNITADHEEFFEAQTPEEQKAEEPEVSENSR